MREAGCDCAARGRLAWVRTGAGDGWEEELAGAVDAVAGASTAVVVVSPERFRPALASLGRVDGVLLRAALPGQRALAALAVSELHGVGLPVRMTGRAPGRVGGRRALAGIEPGGEASRRAARLARALAPHGVGRRQPTETGGLAAEAGQALPLVLGGVLALICATLALAAFGGAVTGKSRVQRAADLAALSAARSMRDDFGRLFVPARRLDGSIDPGHLGKAEYLERAEAAAEQAAGRNGVGEGRLEVEFPDEESFAPLRVRAEDRGRARHAGRAAARAGGRARRGGGRAALATGDRRRSHRPRVRERRRLLRPARVPPGRGPATRRRGGLRPDGGRRGRRRRLAADQSTASAPTPSRRSSGRRTPTRATSRRPGRRFTVARPSSTSARRRPTAGSRPTPSASASSSATGGRTGTTATSPGPAPCSAEGDRVGAGGSAEPSPASRTAATPG